MNMNFPTPTKTFNNNDVRVFICEMSNSFMSLFNKYITIMSCRHCHKRSVPPAYQLESIDYVELHKSVFLFSYVRTLLNDMSNHLII